MTHWYRDPKRVKLIEHLERAGIGFVLCSERFSESDLRNLKTGLQPMKLAERLTMGPPSAGDDRKVLITARQGHPDADWLRNPEPWTGIVVVPAHSPHREYALRVLFSTDRSFPNGARGRRAISKGVLYRFVLDMRSSSPSLYGVGETPLIHLPDAE